MKNKKSNGCLISLIPLIIVIVLLTLNIIPKESYKLIFVALGIGFVIYIAHDSFSSDPIKPKVTIDKAEDVRLAKSDAETQIARIKESYKSGNRQELARDFDTTVEYVKMRKTIAGAYAYLNVIETVSFCYYGTRYPNRHGDLLEDVIRDELKKLPSNHFRG